MSGRSNRLDQWRLFFAALVLVSHSFDLLGRSEEAPLRQYGIGWGGIAVCGFFIISGYLIARSWTQRPVLFAYLRNRFLRIVPAFVVAFLVSVLLVGPILGGGPAAYLPGLDWNRLTFDLVTLSHPHAPAPGPYPIVNGSLWTIRWEFACYLLAPFAVRGRIALAGLWLAALLAAVTTDSAPATWLLMFLSGAAYYRLGASPTTGTLIASAVFLPVSLFTPFWELGLAVAGAPLLLSAGLRPCRPARLPDISYGTYLYGWPIQKMLILAGVGSPWLLLAMSLPLALLAGAASWLGIERHALRFKQHQIRPPTAKTRSELSA